MRFFLFVTGCIVSLVWLAGFAQPVNAQDRDVYTTKEGSMRLLLQKENVDSGIVAETNALQVQFNYDVPKMRFQARLSRFQCSDSALQISGPYMMKPSQRWSFPSKEPFLSMVSGIMSSLPGTFFP